MKVAYEFEGRVAFVTGGSRGIGREIAQALAGAGARVHFSYLTSEQEAAEATAFPARYPMVRHALDVRDPQQVNQVVREIVREHERLDLLVNNAGIVRDLLLGQMRDADIDDVLETNLLGPFHVIRAACRPMFRQRSGAILNISSVAGRRPEGGQSNYAATKGGLNALTRSLALELSPRGIRVNALAPGIVPTTEQLTSKNARLLSRGVMERIPLRRFGTLREVANAALWLLSDAASYVTGAVLDVSGGYRA